MKVAVAAIFFGVITVTFAVVPECPKNGTGNERIPDSEDCGKFYYCKDYVPYPAYCPPSQYFDVITLTCRDASDATCAEGATPAPGDPSPPVDCPEQQDPDDNVLLPNPWDCNSYFQCVWGTPVLQKCPRGLHFNNKLKRCDWPINAKCHIYP